MSWTIKFHNKALAELSKLDKAVQKRILKFFRGRLQLHENPRPLGSPLTGALAGLWKYRVGDYRALCQIENKEITILVLKIGHRKNIYH